MISNTKTIDLGKLGKQKFCKFCHVIKELLIERQVTFDLIVASGNSGLIMAKFTELLYEYLGKPAPDILRIPFYRFFPGKEENFDNYILLTSIIEELKPCGNINSVLFVDDEIEKGTTAFGSLELMNAALDKLGRPRIQNFYIVAEDHGFMLPTKYSEVKFFPHDTKTGDYVKAIFFTTPPELEKPLLDVLGEDEVFRFHNRRSVLFNLPVKDFNKGKPIFTNKYLTLAKESISNLATLQEAYYNNLRSLINDCLGGDWSF